MVVQSWAALASRHFPDYRNVSRPRQMVGGASAAGEGGDEIEFVGECDFWQHK